jgi:membrane protein involved in colicin uptake
MYHTTERNERQSQRHALVLAIALHLALVAMLYFKFTSESVSRQGLSPAKVNVVKEHSRAKARTVQLP